MVRRNKPHYPTRAELEAGAEPVEAVPGSRLLKWATGPRGHMFDRWLVRHSGLSLISWLASRARGISYQKSLLLISRGRKSGIRRPVVLPYVADGDRLIVVASNAGTAKPPAWVGNLVAEPHCTVVIKRRSLQMLASVVEGEERNRLLDLVAVRRPQVFNYEYQARRHGRRMDLVLLAPMGRSPAVDADRFARDANI